MCSNFHSTYICMYYTLNVSAYYAYYISGGKEVCIVISIAHIYAYIILTILSKTFLLQMHMSAHITRES